MPLLALQSSTGAIASIIAPPGETLARVIWLSGLVEPQSMCAGLGLCGKCRLRFITEAPEPTVKDTAIFSDDELQSGWRLGCQHLTPDNAPLEESFLHVEIPQAFRDLAPNAARHEKIGNQNCFLGIDLGTTSIVWRALDSSGEISSGEMPNPQAAAGADVISRLQYAREPENRNQLSRLVVDAINGIIAGVEKDNHGIRRACIAANPAMTEILLERDIAGLCASPYSLDWLGGEILSFPPGKSGMETVFPPLVSPFIGSDISCGILWLLECDTPAPFLLIDLGTNAELALFIDKEHLYITSLPLGPALEGIGPICGQGASGGVANSFSLNPAGIEPQYLPGKKPDGGICATGYLSLIRILLNLGILDKEGHFTSHGDSTNLLARQILLGLDSSGAQKTLHIKGKLFLAESDIEQLLKVRAALVVGINSLLKAAKITAPEIMTWRVAGALGEHASKADLELLGIPCYMADKKLASIGNASLEGACLLAKYPEKLKGLNELCAKAILVQSTEQPDFAKAYLKAMQWQ